YCLLSRRKVAALALAVAACSFKEDVLITTIGLAGGLALLAWRERRYAGLPMPVADSNTPLGGNPAPGSAPAFAQLPAPWVSVVVAAGFLAVTVTVFATMDFARYQVSRHSVLGENAWRVLLSPVLRPGVFWPEVVSDRSLVFRLILFVPFGLANAVRGWPIQVALAVPLGALLAWHNANAKSIAFQYVTCLIVVITWAALIGVRRSPAGRSDPARTMAVEGAAALATALCMSLVFGVLPSSPPTTPFHVGQDRRAEWTAHCRRLDRLVAMINRPDTSVVASGRVASHLLAVRRLEPISDALDRQDLLAREAGPGRTWMDVFEWVLLDRQDMLQLGRETIDETAIAFLQAGFRVYYNADDILLLHRPTPR
ncbi:MAG: DUF2079 domain-containing protein, partial [Phycisphaerae bacterium]|nr:DUF2079 domain-containing protein [Phycisphaerae bacterium]